MEDLPWADCSLGFSVCSEQPAFRQNTDDDDDDDDDVGTSDFI